jgi:hypothetical protein
MPAIAHSVFDGGASGIRSHLAASDFFSGRRRVPGHGTLCRALMKNHSSSLTCFVIGRESKFFGNASKKTNAGGEWVELACCLALTIRRTQMSQFRFLMLAALAAMCLLNSSLTFAQATKQAPAKQVQENDQAPFPDLGEGLRKTDGCLGVDSARTESGKQVIFAWFKDKRAVLDWYHSDMHEGVMNKFFPNRPDREPLADIPDDSGPILAIASITFSDKSQFANTPLPISQIAIELYQPISGGLSMGGTFAPEGLKVDGLKVYSNPKAK